MVDEESFVFSNAHPRMLDLASRQDVFHTHPFFCLPLAYHNHTTIYNSQKSPSPLPDEAAITSDGLAVTVTIMTDVRRVFVGAAVVVGDSIEVERVDEEPIDAREEATGEETTAIEEGAIAMGDVDDSATGRTLETAVDCVATLEPTDDSTTGTLEAADDTAATLDTADVS